MVFMIKQTNNTSEQINALELNNSSLAKIILKKENVINNNYYFIN